MKKKFLALVLTLAMVLSLVPVTALAVGENSPVTEVSTDANSPVQIKKSINAKGDTLTLEAYLTNEVTETVSTKPLDIVLVLDQSGSMAYDFNGNKTNNDTARRQYAMKSAVTNFINEVGKQYSDKGDHRMAIVTFGSDATTLHDWTTVDTTGVASLKGKVNALLQNPQGATNVGAGMERAKTLMNSASAGSNTARQKVVIVFTDGVPTTQSDFDTNVANKAIAASKDMKDAEAVVYTVGIFNGAKPEQLYGNKWNYGMSKDVLCTGEVGSCWGGSWLANLFGNNDFKAIDVPAGNRFLNYLSSNFSGATEIGITYGSYHPGHTEFAAGNGWRIDANFTRTASNYYLTATNADGLNSVFEKIIEEISTLEIEAGTDAILSDTLSEYFDLNIPEGATAESAITVKQWNCTGKDNDGYAWMEASEQPTTINVQVTGKKIEVTGFDYTTNAVTKTTSGSGTVYSGSKLVVTIPIKPDTAYTNWKKGSNLYPTNNKAGLSNYKGKNGETLPSTLLTKSPEAEVTAYTVTYNWGENAPARENIPTNSNTYLTGKTYPVDTTYAKGKEITDSDGGTWHFSGWTDPNNGVMGTKNVTITGSWTHTEPTQPDPTYTLTYDANGGKFGSGEAASTTKQESNITTGNHPLNYSEEYTPTHAKSGDKDVIFLGWSAEPLNVLNSASNAAENAKKIITSVNVTDKGATVYAVWGLDEDGNNIPDVFEATVTYKIEHGHWYNAETGGSVSKDPVTAQFTLYKKIGNQWVAQKPTLGNTIPTGRGGDEGYTADGWYKDSEKTNISKTTPVTGDVTYTFKYVKTSTEATWDVSRSKIASDLKKNSNGDWTTDVTLSLPSAEYEPVIDVVLILDDTYAGNGIFKDAATGLLNELSKKKNLDVNVGIVNFDAVARDWVAATTNSKYSGLVSLKNTEGLTALQNAIATKLDKNNDGQTKKIGATNIEWPLEMAQNMLASGKGTEKYAILFSDMYGYVYRGDLIIDGQTYENVPLSKRLYAGESKFYQGSLSMGTKYQSFADVYAHRNDEENQTTDGFFRDSSWDSYWSIYSGHMQIPTNPATKDSADPFGVPGGYSGFEKSTCLVYDRLLQMKQAGINISIVNNDFAPGDIREVGYVQSIKNDMLDTLEQKGISVIKTQENVTAEDMTNVFDTLKDQLIQVVSAGSTVTDKIGTNFDFVGLNTMSLKIGDNTIPGVIDEATNTITFKHGGKDNAHVVVYDSSADSFTWTINEDVTKDARVQLTYSVKLTKPETAAGTYGVTDLNGDGKVDGTDTTYTDTDALYTNESATMVPKDSNGKTGAELTFPKPSVSYTIKGSSGGHGGNGGGTVTIPDDVPTGLNGKDHYAYVVGYPDGMVYPQKNITRAEVATIFFRLLTDETREANMTKSNSYNDMKDGAWYTCAVSTLSKMGIIKGYEDGSFKPDASISRAEFAAIAARFDPDGDKTPATFSDVSSHWAKDEISIAANHGWIKGYEDGSFKPDQKITRAETMTLVNRVLKRLPETKDDLHKDMKTWPDNQKESAWFYLAVQEATNSHYQKLKKDGTHETWESMRETRDWAALEK